MFELTFFAIRLLFVSTHMLLNPAAEFSTSCESWITERPGNFIPYYLKEYFFGESQAIALISSEIDETTGTSYKSKIIMGLKEPYDILDFPQTALEESQQKAIQIIDDHYTIYIDGRQLGISPVKKDSILLRGYTKWTSFGRAYLDESMTRDDQNYILAILPKTTDIFFAQTEAPGFICSTTGRPCKRTKTKHGEATQNAEEGIILDEVFEQVQNACSIIQSIDFDKAFDSIKLVPNACLPKAEKDTVLQYLPQARKYCSRYEQEIKNKAIDFVKNENQKK